jgi:hypothetical protein
MGLKSAIALLVVTDLVLSVALTHFVLIPVAKLLFQMLVLVHG